MSGHWNLRHATAVRDPLFAHTMVVDDGRAPICLIACDVLSLKRSTVLRAREAISQATGLDPGRIGMSATHTHYGPTTAQLWTQDQDADPDYLRQFEQGIVQAACDAFAARRPAMLGINWGFEGKLSFNRRFIMRDGSALMHPQPGSTDILYQEGATDPEIGVMAARDQAGRPLGYWVNFACHATVSGRPTEISADFPGELSAEMKRRAGAEVVTLFANGCCGNLCQQDVFDPDRLRSGDELIELMGSGLADDVQAAEAGMEFSDQVALDVRSDEVKLPLRHLPPQVVEHSHQVLKDRGSHEHREVKYAEMILELMHEKRQRPLVPAEIQAFRLGEVGIVMLPGEIFVEHGLEIKLRSPARRTFVVELANGIVGYVPTRKAFEGGGYEQRTGNNSKLAPVVGEYMVEVAWALLDSVFR